MQYLTNPLFGVFLSLTVYELGEWLFKKTKGFFLAQPLFFAMISGIAILALLAQIFHVSISEMYTKAYKPGGDIIFWFVQPATIAFAVPLYKRNDIVKKNAFVILASLIIGVIISLFAITFLARAIGLSRAGVASMLSQSATTAIALPLSQAMGGIPAITAMACILNSVAIYAFGSFVIKIFRLQKDPLGLGLGLGTAGHTVGSAFALEMGSIQGAMAA
ncbi:antiholin LrgB, partial [Lactobacillus sp. XV13L]|nr:antiholin LrgB [Lactobacillus sp. XV13L]